jgi:hypothetical protein
MKTLPVYLITIYTGNGTTVIYEVLNFNVDEHGIVRALSTDRKSLVIKALNWSVREL